MLERGVVCDKCNNYFARKVEGPLLSHVSFRNLRAWYRVPNKRGISPSLYGFVSGTDIDIAMRVNTDGGIDIQPAMDRTQNQFKDRLRSQHSGALPSFLVFPLNIDPPQGMMSRFLAKMALEVLSLRFSHSRKLLNLLIDEPLYDRIRNWARRNECPSEWPYSQRRIFPEETLMRHPQTNEWVQAGFGYDLILNKRRETYFAICFYGYEFVINIGGPSIKGYEEWLVDHGNISPLVERIGQKLQARIEGGKKKYFLVGDTDTNVGRKFDRSELGKNLHVR